MTRSVASVRVGGQEVPLHTSKICRVCMSPYRYEIETFLAEGETYRRVGWMFSIGRSSVHTHLCGHMGPRTARPRRGTSCLVCRSPHRDFIEEARGRRVTYRRLEALLVEEFGSRISFEAIRGHFVKGHSPDDEGPDQSPARRGFIYMARFSDRIKIGFSVDPDQRLRHIPHDEVLRVFPGTMEDEARLLDRFAHLRVKGEWFQMHEDILGWTPEGDLDIARPIPARRS